MKTYRAEFRSMNTTVELLLATEEHEQADRAMLEVQELFFQTESICSRFLQDNELAQLNRSQGQTFTVSLLLDAALLAAYSAYQQTAGLFNPGILPNLERAGYDTSLDQVLARTNAAPNLPPQPVDPAFPVEWLDRTKRQVRLLEGRQVDLGGIVKGWTVDRAAAHLARCGAGLVNAGGDLRVFGQQDEAWEIGIADPFEPDRDIAYLPLFSGALATSSSQKRRWQQGDAWHHHLIDPATGLPSDSSIVSATVTAPTCEQADVWAKTVLLLGPEQGLEWIAKRGAHALLVDAERKIWRN